MNSRNAWRLTLTTPTTLACNLILPMFVAVASIAAASAATRITVTFDDVVKEILPTVKDDRIPNTRKYTLDKNNNLSVDSSSNHHTWGGLGKVGTGTDLDGVTYKWTFRILNGVIYLVNDYPNFVSVTKIKSNGVDSCTATRVYNKKRGGPYVAYIRHENVTIADDHAENVACSIEMIPD
jgi:hypothetical protein